MNKYQNTQLTVLSILRRSVASVACLSLCVQQMTLPVFAQSGETTGTGNTVIEATISSSSSSAQSSTSSVNSASSSTGTGSVWQQADENANSSSSAATVMTGTVITEEASSSSVSSAQSSTGAVLTISSSSSSMTSSAQSSTGATVGTGTTTGSGVVSSTSSSVSSEASSAETETGTTVESGSGADVETGTGTISSSSESSSVSSASSSAVKQIEGLTGGMTGAVVAILPTNTHPTFSIAKHREVSSAKELKERLEIILTGSTGQQYLAQGVITEKTGAYYVTVTPPSQFVPGLYIVRGILSSVKGENRTLQKLFRLEAGAADILLFEQSFIWGGVAFGFDRSEYTAGNTAQLQFSLVGNQGEILCDKKNVSVSVVSPSGSTTEYTNESDLQVRACSVRKFTDFSDYELSTTFSEAGSYRFIIKREDKTLLSYEVVVKDEKPLVDIERTSVIRAFAEEETTMEITVTPNVTFIGTIEESVPSSFFVKDIEPFSHFEESLDQLPHVITWNRKFEAGVPVVLKYTIIAPKKAGTLFSLLGPLSIEGEMETGTKQNTVVSSSSSSAVSSESSSSSSSEESSASSAASESSSSSESSESSESSSSSQASSTSSENSSSSESSESSSSSQSSIQEDTGTGSEVSFWERVRRFAHKIWSPLAWADDGDRLLQMNESVAWQIVSHEKGAATGIKKTNSGALALTLKDEQGAFSANEEVTLQLLDTEFEETDEEILDEDGKLKEEFAIEKVLEAVVEEEDLSAVVGAALIENDQTSEVQSEDMKKVLENDTNTAGLVREMLVDDVQKAVVKTLAKELSGSGTTKGNLDKKVKEEAGKAAQESVPSLIKSAEKQIEKAVKDEGVSTTKKTEDMNAVVPVIEVKLRGTDGKVITPKFHYKKGSVLLVLEPERKFTPGIYTAEVTITNPLTGDVTELTQDFAWGVLAMNPNQDRYTKGDTAQLAFGVLDDIGEPVCDAEVTLTVETPSGEGLLLTTEDGSIENTGGCSVKEAGFIEPDYQAYLKFVEEGTYNFVLEATTDSGTRSIAESIEVAASHPIIVKRSAATRLWPYAPSPMDITIEFTQEFEGTITDTVPEGFEIVSSSPEATLATVAEASGTGTTLTWTGKWRAGQKATLSYVYDAPDISPEFYLLGPLEFAGTNVPVEADGPSASTMREQRAWQIANDVADAFDDTTYIGTASGAEVTGGLLQSKDFDNGSYIEFNGSSQYGIATGYKGVTGTSARTVALWFNTTQSGATIEVPLYYGADGGNGVQYQTSIESGVAYLRLGNNVINMGSNLNDGKWHHIAFTNPSSAKITNVSAYLDGEPDGTIVINGGETINTTAANDVSIGSRKQSAATYSYFDGYIDDVRMYNAELSATQIKELVTIGREPPTANLQAHWKFDDGTGTTSVDSSGNGRTITFTGTPTWETTGSSNYTQVARITSADLQSEGYNPDTFLYKTAKKPAGATARLQFSDDGSTWVNSTGSGTSGYGAYLFEGTDNDVITVPAASSINSTFNGGGTWMTWIKPASIGEGSTGRIMHKAATDGNDGTELYVCSLNRICFRKDWSGGNFFSSWRTHTKYAYGDWLHVAVTYDESSESNDPTIYINGAPHTIANGLLLQEYEGTGTADSDDSHSLKIGSRGTNREFDGYISDVRIYKGDVLSEATIANYARKGIEPTETVDAHWKFNGNANDETANNNDGTVSGATNTTTWYNLPALGDITESDNAILYFDGTNDTVTVSDNNAFTFGDDATTDSPFSVSGWFKVYDDVNNATRLVGKYTSAGDKEWLLFTSGANYFGFFLYDNSGATGTLTAQTNDIIGPSNQYQWVHYAATYDGSSVNTGIKLYLNGREMDASYGGATYSAMHNTSAPVYIMSDASTYTEGSAANVSVWSDVRTQAEIVAEVEQGYTDLSDGNLVAHWPLDDGTGTTADNAEGTATYDASISGAVWTTDINRPAPSQPVEKSIDISGLSFSGDFYYRALYTNHIAEMPYALTQVEEAGENNITNIGGKVYMLHGTGAMTGKTIGLSVDGGAVSLTTETNGVGAYVFTGATIATGSIVTVFLDDETENGMTVITASGGFMQGIDIYKDHLIVRNASGSTAITNAILNIADGSGDSDITAILESASDAAIKVGTGYTLLVSTGTTMTPGGTITTDNLTIYGTLVAESNTITVNGDWDVRAGTFTPGTSTVVFGGTGQTLFGSGSFYNLTKQAPATQTLTLEANSEQSISNTLTLQGVVSGLLSLVPFGGAAEHPLEDEGSESETYCCSADYTIGYEFIPSEDITVTELGLRAEASTQNVRLYECDDDTCTSGTLLANTDVTATGTSNWVYESISPVSLTAGNHYISAVYLTGVDMYYHNYTVPFTQGSIEIQNGIYTSGDGFPLSDLSGAIYGQPDIGFGGGTAKIALDAGTGTQSLEYLKPEGMDASNGAQLNCYTAEDGCVDGGSNTNWAFTQTYSLAGTAYSDEGSTALTGKTVALSLNGGTATTDEVDSGGMFEFTGVIMTGGTVISLYLDDETEDAVTVVLGSGSSMTGIHLYQNRLIVRSESGSYALTNQHLDVANNNGDSDISAIYTMTNTELTMVNTKELLVWVGSEYAPGDVVNADDIDINGVLSMSSSGVTVVKGSWDQTGGYTSNSGTVMFTSTGSETITNGSFNDVILNDGLVGYWKFDEGTGSNGAQVKDSSGYGNTGTLVNHDGDEWLSGAGNVAPTGFYNPYALDFNGTDEYVRIPDDDSLDFEAGRDFTYSLWFKTSKDYSAAEGGLLTKDQGGGIYNYFFTIATNNVIRAQTGFSERGIIPESPTINDNKWHNVTLTHTAAVDTLYIDGIESGTSTESYTYTANAVDLIIGAGDEGASAWFDGTIDEVRIYKLALDERQVGSLASGAGPASGNNNIQLSGALDVNGDLILHSSDFDAEGNAITVAGSWENTGGRFGASGATVTFDGSAGSHTIQSAGQEFDDLSIAGAATWTLSSDLDVDGLYSQSAGTLDARSGENYTVRTESINQSAGTITPRSGDIVIDGKSDSTITITSSLNNLQIESPLEEGLVGYWKMDEGQGNYVYDSSGNSATGTIISSGTGGVTWSGSVASAITFDNPYAIELNEIGYPYNTEYIDLGTPSAINTNTLSVGGWAKVDSDGLGNNTSIFTRDNTNNETIFLWKFWSTNKFQFRIKNVSGTESDIVANSAASAGRWYHVMGTYNGTNQYLYIDGVLQTNKATVTGYAETASYANVTIGGRADLSKQWAGGLDDIRYYNRALSPGEVKSLANGNYGTKAIDTTTFTLGADLDVDNDLIIQNGTLAADSYTITIGNDWKNYAGTGSFASGNGTVTFDGGTGQTLFGSTRFNNLTKAETSAETIRFEGGTQQSVSGALTLNGADSQLLSLNSTKDGTTNQTPLQTAGLGTINAAGSTYNMGYRFSPLVAGFVTQLGLLCNSGTRDILLYECTNASCSTGRTLREAVATALGTSTWVYESIDPVWLEPGRRYVVTTYSRSNNYCYATKTMPFTQGDIVVEGTTYVSSSTAMPTNLVQTTMYGLADITFVTQDAGLRLDAATGTQTLSYLDIKNMNASSGATLSCTATGDGCVDSGNNTNWTIGNTQSIAGTVYSDEGTTPLAGVEVAASLNGGAIGINTATTDAGGQYEITNLSTTGGTIISLYLNGETQKAVTVTLGSGSNMTGIHLYQDHLILRSESGSVALTNNHLRRVHDNIDTDVDAIFTMNGTVLNVTNGKELFVWNGKSYTPGARVITDNIEVQGTLTMGTNELTVSGSLVANAGTLSTSTGIVLNSTFSSNEILNLGSNSIQDLTIDSNRNEGLVLHWKFDEGTGTSARDSSGNGKHGTLYNTPTWVTDTPPLRVHNPYALDFDKGSSEYGRAIGYKGVTGTAASTFMAWFKTSSTATDLAIVYWGGAGTAARRIIKLENGVLWDRLAGATINAGSGLNDGQWHHFAMAKPTNGTTSDYSVYVDGSEIATNPTGADTVNIIATDDVYVGSLVGVSNYFDGALDDVRLYNREVGAAEMALLGAGYASASTGSYVLGSKLDVNGDLNIYEGGLDVSESNYDVTVAGNLLNYDIFNTQQGRVAFDGTGNQTLSGSTFFYNFTATGSSARTVYMDYTGAQSVSGALIMNGVDGSLLSLRSTKNSTAAPIALDTTSGTQTMSYLDVQDSNASSGATLTCNNCTNNGNNTNWAFTSGFSITGTVYTDEGTTPLSGVEVAASLNGGLSGGQTDTTDAGGQFTITGLTMTGGTIVALYLNGETQKAVTVTLSNGATMTGMHLYQDRLIVRSESGSVALTNNDLQRVQDNSDSDIDAIFTMTNTELNMVDGKEFYVWSGDTFSATDKVSVDDIDINGTLVLSSSGTNIVRGSWDATGGVFTASGTTMFTSTNAETITSNSNAFQDIILNDGLVGYWKLDEGSGTETKDSSGNGHTGTLVNTPTWTASAAPTNFNNPYALDFIEASSEIVSIPDSDDFTFGDGTNDSAFSVSAWVNMDDVTQFSILNKGDNNSNEEWLFSSNNSSRISLTLIDSVNGGERVRNSDILADTANRWIHVAATYDGRGGTSAENGIHIYRDGLQIENNTYTTGTYVAMNNTSENAQIGSRGTTQYADGTIDEVRLYKRILSPLEIAALASGNQPATTSGAHILLSGALDINGDLRLNSGDLDAAGNSITVAGSWENNGGRFGASGATVNFDGASGSHEILSGGQEFDGFTVSGAGSWTLSDALDVDTFSQSAGTVDVRSGSNYAVRAESFSQTAGTFTPQSGTVVLDGKSDSTFIASSALYDLQVEDATEDSLVGYWKFDEGQGDKVYDSSGNSHTGSIVTGTGGVTWSGSTAAGITFNNPYSLEFDGQDDEVTIPDHNDFSFGNGSSDSPFSVSAWINMEDAYLFKIIDKDDISTKLEWSFHVSTTNLLTLDLRDSSTAAYRGRRTASVEGYEGEWIHVAATYNGVGGTNAQNGIDVYINGIAADTDTNSSNTYTAMENTVQPVQIGARGTTQFAKGYIDEARIYNKELSAEEVANLANGKYTAGNSAGATFTLGADLDVNNDLYIQSGQLGGSSYNVNLAGDWLNYAGSGGFVHGTSTVVLDGTNQTITGTGSFWNLNKTGSTGERVTFTSGDKQTIANVWSMSGSNASNLLSLSGSVAGAQWIVDPIGSRLVANLIVEDSLNSNATTVECTDGCTDSGNNTNWNFGSSIVGTVYTDEGSTPLAGVEVAASLNGGLSGGQTDTTDAGGQFTITGLTMTGGTIVALYLNGETQKAVTVTLGSGSTMTGMHLYQDRLIVRSESGSVALTNADLALADNGGDADVSAIYTLDSSNTLTLAADKELYVWNGDSFTPGARVKAHDVEVLGTLTMGTNGLTVSGSLVANAGTFTTSTGIVLSSLSSANETLSLGTNSIQDLTINKGLVGYWKFDEGTGTVARDSSGHGHHGTLTGVPTWTSTVASTRFYNPYSLDFNGTTDYVGVPDNADFDITGELSISTWINKPQTGIAESLISKYKTGIGQGAYTFSVRATGVLQLDLSNNGTGNQAFTSTLVVDDDQWHHVAVTRNGGVVTFYKDGIAEVNGATFTGNIFSSSEDLQIGRLNSNGVYFEGIVDDVRIYNRALASTEVSRLASGYASTASGTYVLGSKLDINGNLNIISGGLDVSGNNYGVTVAGNMMNVGTFDAQAGRVAFDGTGNQTLSGSTVFYNLTATGSSARTIYMDYTGRASASGALTMNGVDGNLLSIRSTHSGSGARLLLDGTSGTQTLSYLDVQDSNASGGAELDCTGTCTDSGNNTNWNFGGATASGSINGRVFIDTDDDAALDAAEVSGIQNVEVNLYGTTSTGMTLSLSGTTVTDGFYAFTGALLSNSAGYTITVDETTVPTGYIAKTFTSSGGNLLGTGQTLQVNFGYFWYGTLTGSVLIDTNGNGIIDGGETSTYAGATVTLSGTSSSGGTLNISTTSTSTGAYFFHNVPVSSGSYTLTLTDVNGVDVITIGTESGAVTSGNQIQIDPLAVQLRTATGSINGRLWNDTDGDGTLDAGETSGFTGVDVTLNGNTSTGMVLSLSGSTAADGFYAFTGALLSDSDGYTIAINTDEIPAGYLRTTVTSSGGNLLGTGQTLQVNFGLVAVSTVSGAIFVDTNEDDVFDSGETAFSGAVVSLTGTSATGGTISVSTTTNASGTYLFNNLPPSSGSYVVAVTPPDGYEPVSASSRSFSITSGGTAIVRDIGYTAEDDQGENNNNQGTTDSVGGGTGGGNAPSIPIRTATTDDDIGETPTETGENNPDAIFTSDRTVAEEAQKAEEARQAEVARRAEERIREVETARRNREEQIVARETTRERRIREAQERFTSVAFGSDQAGFTPPTSILAPVTAFVGTTQNLVERMLGRVGTAVAAIPRAARIAMENLVQKGETNIRALAQAVQLRREMQHIRRIAFDAGARTVRSEALRQVGIYNETVQRGVTQSLNAIQQNAQDASNRAIAILENNAGSAGKAVAKGIEGVRVAFNAVGTGIKNTGNAVLDGAGTVVETGVSIAQGLQRAANTTLTAANTIIENSIDVVGRGASTVILGAGKGVAVALRGIEGAMNGVQNGVIAAVDGMRNVQDATTNAIAFINTTTRDTVVRVGEVASRSYVQFLDESINAVESGLGSINDYAQLSLVAVDKGLSAVDGGKNAVRQYISYLRGRDLQLARKAAPILPEQKQYRTQISREADKTVIASLHLNVFDSFGLPYSKTPVVLFSSPKVAITDDEGIATFHDVETGTHHLEVHTNAGEVERREIVLEPPSGITAEEQVAVDVVLPVIQVVVSGSVSGQTGSSASVPLYAFFIVLVIAGGNIGLGYLLGRRRQRFELA